MSLSNTEFGIQLVDWLYGELSPAEVIKFEAHLQAHPEAKAEAEALRDIRSAFQGLGEVEAPLGVSALLLTQAAEHARPRRGLWATLLGWVEPLVLHPAASAMATLLLLVGVGGALYVRNGESMMATPNRQASRVQAPEASQDSEGSQAPSPSPSPASPTALLQGTSAGQPRAVPGKAKRAEAEALPGEVSRGAVQALMPEEDRDQPMADDAKEPLPPMPPGDGYAVDVANDEVQGAIGAASSKADKSVGAFSSTLAGGSLAGRLLTKKKFKRRSRRGRSDALAHQQSAGVGSERKGPRLKTVLPRLKTVLPRLKTVLPRLKTVSKAKPRGSRARANVAKSEKKSESSVQRQVVSFQSAARARNCLRADRIARKVRDSHLAIYNRQIKGSKEQSDCETYLARQSKKRFKSKNAKRLPTREERANQDLEVGAGKAAGAGKGF